MAAGLEDLVVLVINEAEAPDAVELVEGYELPILQDTAEADVFGLYDAHSYDLFVIDRAGLFHYAESSFHPSDEGDQAVLLEVLAELQ